jgi:hypothetical protein
MKKLIPLFVIFLFSNIILAQTNFKWAKNIAGTAADQGNSISIDINGNVYTIGDFEGTVDFDPGVGITNLTTNGGNDIFIQKLDSSGNFLWAKNMGGPSSDFGRSISIDTRGNVYTTGYFRGTADFDPGAGTTNLISNGATDTFISKLDSSGNFIWAKSLAGLSWDNGISITTDASGNVYTIGNFRDTVDFDPGVGSAFLTPNGIWDDIFISKLDSNGNFLWAKNMGGAGSDFGLSISIDLRGNVYTTGNFRFTSDFDPGAGITNLSSNGDSDVFISKLDSNGNFLWVKSMGGTGSDQGNSLITGASENIYTVGYFAGTVDFNPGAGTTNLMANGSYDIFIQKLDTNGNFLWAKNIGGSAFENGLFITIDTNENIYTTGEFQGTVDFDPGTGITNLTAIGATDVFILKLDSSGNFQWAKSVGGTGADKGNSITTDVNGNVYTTGFFNGIVDFDPEAGIANITAINFIDIFILKLDQYGIVGIDNENFRNDIFLFPNPTTGKLSVFLDKELPVNSIIIKNNIGQVIHSEKSRSGNYVEMNISAYPSGIYFLQVESEGEVLYSKILKQ